MYWVNILHFYQPSWQTKEMVDRIVSESYQPILDILEKHSSLKISLNICASLIEHLNNFGYIDILKQIKSLALNGQIELLGSAKYHPLLPLIPQKEVIRQIKLNEALSSKYFGKTWRPRPKGFFLPEIAYNQKTARIIEKLGYQYLILDEIAYNGKIGENLFSNNWRIKEMTLKVVFRNRPMSDIFFQGQFNKKEQFWQALAEDGRSNKILITAFDGENLGHHHQGRERTWEQILLDKRIKSLTAEESLTFFSQEKEVVPLPSTWSSSEEDLKNGIPYPLWKQPKNIIHQYQWQLTNLALKAIKYGPSSPNFKLARKFLDQALASDGYWWASRSPWWSPQIVRKTRDIFLEVFHLLQDVLPAQYLEEAEIIKNKIDQELKKCSG